MTDFADSPGADHHLIRRRDAAQATLDQWRDVPFRLGHADCVRMVASHLRRLGYTVRLPSAGSYRTWRTARATLARLGHAGVAEWLDSLGLVRIAPAATIVGDIVQLSSGEGMDDLAGLSVVLGNGRVANWHEHAPRGGVQVMQPHAYMAAWRAAPVERAG